MYLPKNDQPFDWSFFVVIGQEARKLVTLECSVCKNRSYHTEKRLEGQDAQEIGVQQVLQNLQKENSAQRNKIAFDCSSF